MYFTIVLIFLYDYDILSNILNVTDLQIQRNKDTILSHYLQPISLWAEQAKAHLPDS